MKKAYFTTVCFLPLALTVLYPMVFLLHVPFPSAAFLWLAVYVWIGIVVLLVDLWRTKLDKERKALWTVAVLFAGLITLPIYWFRYVKKGRSGGGQAAELSP